MNTADIALRRMVFAGLFLSFTATPIAMLIGFLVEGIPGIAGAGIGMGMSLFFIGLTSLLALATRKLNVQALGYVVLISWLMKIVILIAVLAWLRGHDFYHRPTLMISMLIGLVGYLTIEALISLKSRVLYVEPN
ncbi:MAG: hypothetical protein FJW76_02295 [Actinobacteria bacterium]|nr:hypothetical protein [Actinomycetota bacterium]